MSSCDSDSHDSCSNCKTKTDEQCCALCPITNERCKRKSAPGLSRCRQHNDLCKSLYNEYKDLCKDLFDIDFKDLNDDQFYKKYKDLEKCVAKRREQSRICYPFHDNKEKRETEYKGCYFNDKHDRILQRYDHKIKKFKKRFDNIQKTRKGEFKEQKKSEMKIQFQELEKLEKLKEKLSASREDKSSHNKKEKKKTPKKKKSPKKIEVKKKSGNIGDILKEFKNETNIIEKKCKTETRDGKLCNQSFPENCKDYCIKNCPIWIKDLFKNLPNNVKLEFNNKGKEEKEEEKEEILFLNINSIFVTTSKNNKINSEGYMITYDYPFNGKRQYKLVDRFTSNVITLSNDEFIKNLCNNFESYITLTIIIKKEHIKDLDKFAKLVNNNTCIASFVNNGLFKPLKVELKEFNDTQTYEFEYKMKF